MHSEISTAETVTAAAKAKNLHVLIIPFGPFFEVILDHPPNRNFRAGRETLPRFFYVNPTDPVRTNPLGRITSKPETDRLRREQEVPAREPKISRSDFPVLCVQRQVAAVRMFLRFLGLGVLAFEVSERYVKRLVLEAAY